MPQLHAIVDAVDTPTIAAIYAPHFMPVCFVDGLGGAAARDATGLQPGMPVRPQLGRQLRRQLQLLLPRASPSGT